MLRNIRSLLQPEFSDLKHRAAYERATNQYALALGGLMTAGVFGFLTYLGATIEQPDAAMAIGTVFSASVGALGVGASGFGLGQLNETGRAFRDVLAQETTPQTA